MVNSKKKEEGLYPRRKIVRRRTPPESPSPLPSSGAVSNYLVALPVIKLKLSGRLLEIIA
jgi:hypothetical protein